MIGIEKKGNKNGEKEKIKKRKLHARGSCINGFSSIY